MDILEWFDLDSCPTAQFQRLRFQNTDYCTTYARALAWFSKWPRCGDELDNLVGSRKYKPMDASHTCHHEHCIVHLVYESADVNDDRKSCCELAKQLRREKKEIPEHCDKHCPSCLLQVSISIFEYTFRIDVH